MKALFKKKIKRKKKKKKKKGEPKKAKNSYIQKDYAKRKIIELPSKKKRKIKK